MRTEKEVKERIKNLEKRDAHVLTGEFSQIDTNAPRALMQLNAEAKLIDLYWVIGKVYKSKLRR